MKEIEIPEGYTARIDGNKVILEPKDSEGERIRKAISAAICGTAAISVLEANGTNLPDTLAYLEKQKEQKPESGNSEKPNNHAEWSEEEKGILLECISALQNSSNWLLADWLKSLRPQPKVRWTIEDAKPGDILTTDTVTFIFKSVDKDGFVSMYCSYAVSTEGTNLDFSDTSNVDANYVHPASVEQRREFLEKLLSYKSPLFCWKPSEEQMVALARATNRCVGVEDAKILIKLLEQLKKL